MTNVQHPTSAPAVGNMSAGFTGAARMLTSTQPHSSVAGIQGLTLLHYSAQRKRFLWDRG